MLNLERPIIFFDLETTGLDVNRDRIVEMWAAKYLPDGTHTSRTARFNPTIPISKESSDVHGITDESVADCPTFADRAAAIFEFFEGCDLGGFNVTHFDVPLIANEFARAGYWLDLRGVRCVDASAIFRAHERRDLTAAYAFYCGKVLEGAHGAKADGAASIEVTAKQIERYGLDPTVDALAKFGRPIAVDPSGKIALNGNGEMALTFGKYKDRTLTDLAARDPGYLDWILEGEFAPTTKAIVEQVVAGPVGAIAASA